MEWKKYLIHSFNMNRQIDYEGEHEHSTNTNQPASQTHCKRMISFIVTCIFIFSSTKTKQNKEEKSTKKIHTRIIFIRTLFVETTKPKASERLLLIMFIFECVCNQDTCQTLTTITYVDGVGLMNMNDISHQNLFTIGYRTIKQLNRT
jgi:hypothetical protein